MLDKLAELEKKYESITEKLYSPEVGSQPDLLRKYSKEQKELLKLIYDTK